MPWHYYIRCVDKIKEMFSELQAELAKRRGQEEAARRISQSLASIRTGLRTMPEPAGGGISKARSQSTDDVHATKAQNANEVVVLEGSDDPFVSPAVWMQYHSVVPPTSSNTSYTALAQIDGQRSPPPRPAREAQSAPTDHTTSSLQAHSGSHTNSGITSTPDAHLVAGGLTSTGEYIIVYSFMVRSPVNFRGMILWEECHLHVVNRRSSSSTIPPSFPDFALLTILFFQIQLLKPSPPLNIGLQQLKLRFLRA